MLKGDERAIKQLERLKGTNLFEKSIQAIRSAFDIPIANGFDTKEKVHKWYQEKYLERRDALLIVLSYFLNNIIKLPDNTWWQQKILNYILMPSDDILSMITYVWPYVEVQEKKDDLYTDLRIYKGASKDEVRDFVIQKWTSIRLPLVVGGHRAIRKDANYALTRRAKELSKMKKSELRSLSDSDSVYKNKLISEILSKEFDSKISEAAIKMRLYRHRRRKK
jgi:hypothetical protein